MILDEFTGRNCKRTEYIDARGRHWIVRTDPVFVERKLDRYETTLLLKLEHCNVPHRRATSATKERAYLKHDELKQWQLMAERRRNEVGKSIDHPRPCHRVE